MPKKINVRAVYKNSVLTPLAPLDLPEGEVVTLTVLSLMFGIPSKD